MSMESPGKKKRTLRETFGKIGQAAYMASALYGANTAGNNLREAQNTRQAQSQSIEVGNEVSTPGQLEGRNDVNVGKYENTPSSTHVEDRRTENSAEGNINTTPQNQDEGTVTTTPSHTDDGSNGTIQNQGGVIMSTPAHQARNHPRHNRESNNIHHRNSGKNFKKK